MIKLIREDKSLIVLEIKIFKNLYYFKPSSFHLQTIFEAFNYPISVFYFIASLDLFLPLIISSILAIKEPSQSST